MEPEVYTGPEHLRDRVLYVGTLVASGEVADLMVYDDLEECIYNLKDAIRDHREAGLPELTEAVIRKHHDQFPNQTTDIAYTAQL